MDTKLDKFDKSALTFPVLCSMFYVLKDYRTDPLPLLLFYLFGCVGYGICLVKLWKSE